MVSFHAEEQGAFDHQDKMPDVPPPEKLTAEEVAKQPMFREMPDFIRRYYESDRPIELRPVELGRYFGQKIETGASMSGSAPRQSSPTIRRCTCAPLAYASDFSAARRGDGALRPHAVRQADDAGEPRPMRCGFTARSALTNGCSTRRIPRARRTAAG